MVRGRFSATVLHIFTNYSSPEKITNMNCQSHEALRKLFRGRFSTVDFAKLRHLAKNTVDNTENFLSQEVENLEFHSHLDLKVDETIPNFV